MAWSTDLTRVRLLGRLRAWKVHWIRFCLILSNHSFQDICIMVEFSKGAPKYLEGNTPSQNYKILRMFLLVTFRMLKKYTWDFSLLTSIPLDYRNLSNAFFKAQASCTVDGPISIVSSTNCWWDCGSNSLLRWSPRSWFSLCIFLSMHPSPSTMMINKNGDKGSPWWIPLEIEKGYVGVPFDSIEKKAEETRFVTHSIQSSWNPKFLAFSS